MSSWNTVPKPTTANWIDVSKPTEASVLSMNGNAQPIGFLIAITSVTGASTSSVITGWTDITKPINSVWSAVAKPTS